MFYFQSLAALIEELAEPLLAFGSAILDAARLGTTLAGAILLVPLRSKPDVAAAPGAE
jgi:hypothetical protein